MLVALAYTPWLRFPPGQKARCEIRVAVACADFRQGGVTLKYVKRGYHVLVTHALTLLLLPVAATVVVSLASFT